MKHIQLTKGQFTIVNDCDYHFLNQWKWYAMWTGTKFYAARSTRRPQRRMVYMHQLIAEQMQSPESAQIDHENGNGLDNRRRNLRPATPSRNGANRGLNKNNTSGVKGVYWDKGTQKWRVEIKVERKRIRGGRFEDIREAAIAYNKLAIQHFGEFAKLNQVS